EKISPARPKSVDVPATVVILGGGASGHACAERLRAEGHTGRIIIIASDPADPVDRPNLSKDYLAGNAPEEWIPLRGDDFYKENGIDMWIKGRVGSIDSNARGMSLRY